MIAALDLPAFTPRLGFSLSAALALLGAGLWLLAPLADPPEPARRRRRRPSAPDHPRPRRRGAR